MATSAAAAQLCKLAWRRGNKQHGTGILVFECVSGCVSVSVILHACVGLGEGWVHAAASAILVVMVVITAGVKSSKYCLCITSRGAHTHTRVASCLSTGRVCRRGGGWVGEGAAMGGLCVFADRLCMLRLCKRPWLQLLVVWMCPHEASRVANIDPISSHDHSNSHWGRKTCLWKADSKEIGGRMGG